MLKPSPQTELATFIEKFSPLVTTQAHAVLERLRARVPGAIELVYDNYNALAIGFCATERASDVILSVAVFPRWVSLFLMNSVQFPDPHRVLKGGGKTVRHIVLDGAQSLDEPAVEALIAHALAVAAHPIDPEAPSRIVIKSVSAKQRPRRPESRVRQ